MDTENYIEILEKYVSIDWNKTDIYEKMLKQLFKQYELEKLEIQ